MRFGLRWKILFVTVVTPLALGIAVVFKVQREVAQHVDSSSIHESLEQAVRVFEDMIAERGRSLAGLTDAMARDPRFERLRTLGPQENDERVLATLRDAARELNTVARAEVFEVFDAGGRRLVALGRARSSAAGRDALIDAALAGRSSRRIVLERRTQYQMCASPVRADGRVVGALLLGTEVGGRLAQQVRAQMRSEVTFIADTAITATTLLAEEDQIALIDHVDEQRRRRKVSDDVTVAAVHGYEMDWATVLRRLPGTPEKGRQFYVLQRSHDAETEFQKSMQRSLTSLAFIGVFAALLAGLLFSEYVTAPIQQLVRGAQEMKDGNYDHPMDIRSRDEIGYLADRFLEMRQREQVYVNSLEEASRLKSEFIAVASHELRTPISAIQGYTDLLYGGAFGEMQPQQQQALDGIKNCLYELTRIAERATLVAQVQGERLELDLQIRSIEPLLRHAVGAATASSPSRTVRVEIQCDPIEPLALDGELIAQAVTHLVSNGIRFTPDRGLVELLAVERAGYLEIRVTDEGSGIPLERLAHLFDHGYAVRDPLQHHSSAELEFNSRGLGLGLGIIRGIVEAHGGTVSANNRQGAIGTIFLVRIPIRRVEKTTRAA